jgi:hypothetical protein
VQLHLQLCAQHATHTAGTRHTDSPLSVLTCPWRCVGSFADVQSPGPFLRSINPSIPTGCRGPASATCCRSLMRRWTSWCRCWTGRSTSTHTSTWCKESPRCCVCFASGPADQCWHQGAAYGVLLARHLIAVTVCIAVTTKQPVQLLDGPQHQHTHQHVGPAGCHDLHGIQLVFRDSASPTNRLNLVGGCNQDFGIIDGSIGLHGRTGRCTSGWSWCTAVSTRCSCSTP